jgi:AcrR family transcriptional regulator
VPDPTAAGASGRRYNLDALLDAARLVFSRDGFAAAQIVDIARVAGTTKPTLYARIGNKGQLYLAVVRREADVFLERVVAAYTRGGDLPLGQLADIGMEPLFGFARERAEGFRVLFGGDSVDVETARVRREVIDGVIERLASLVRHRQEVFGEEPDGTADLVAAACVGLALQVCERATERDGDLVAAQHLAARFVENAIRHLDLESLPEHRKA